MPMKRPICRSLEAVRTFQNATLSAADRLACREAKAKELKSFFDNNVWFIDDASNSEEKRVLKAHPLHTPVEETS